MWRFHREKDSSHLIRNLKYFLAIASYLLGNLPAYATWPERPVRLVVPVAAGGGVDLMARILADRLSQQLPQRVNVENVGGGGGAIAARREAGSTQKQSKRRNLCAVKQCGSRHSCCGLP
ncbi:MAG: hypothetical protein WAL80_04605 [Xanthobacteraceae bacterium]